jgi:NAD(P)H-flavin reductase
MIQIQNYKIPCPQLLQKSREFRRVYVCGPPSMTKFFEKVLLKQATLFKLNPLTDVQIM